MDNSFLGLEDRATQFWKQSPHVVTVDAVCQVWVRLSEPVLELQHVLFKPRAYVRQILNRLGRLTQHLLLKFQATITERLLNAFVSNAFFLILRQFFVSGQLIAQLSQTCTNT